MVGQCREFYIFMLQMLIRLLSELFKIRIATKLIVMFNVECSHSVGLHRKYKMAYK